MDPPSWVDWNATVVENQARPCGRELPVGAAKTANPVLWHGLALFGRRDDAGLSGGGDYLEKTFFCLNEMDQTCPGRRV